MNTKATIVLAALAAVAPSTAFAQLQATTGFPVGEKSRIHTSLEAGVAYDSNRDRFDGNERDGQLDDWRAIVRPSLEVDVPGTTFRLGLDGQLTITQFFGTGDIESDTNYGGSVGVDMQLGSDQSVVSFKLQDRLVRTPTYFDESGTIASDERRFPQWFNDGTARLTFRPGGRALELDFGYQNRLALYDSEATTLPQGQQHGGLFEARWRFLPKTVLMFHGDASTFIVDNDPRPEIQRTSESIPIHVYLGAIGQVTSKLQAELTAGYGDVITDDSERRIQGPIGSAVLKYNLTEAISFRGGYRRTIEPTVTLSAFSSDAGFLEFRSVLFGRLVFALYGQYELRTFAKLPDPMAPGLQDGSTASLIIGDARVEYWFFEWLRASINYRVLYQDAEEEARVSTDDTSLLGLQEFNRHQVFFNVGFRY